MKKVSTWGKIRYNEMSYSRLAQVHVLSRENWNNLKGRIQKINTSFLFSSAWRTNARGRIRPFVTIAHIVGIVCVSLQTLCNLYQLTFYGCSLVSIIFFFCFVSTWTSKLSSSDFNYGGLAYLSPFKVLKGSPFKVKDRPIVLVVVIFGCCWLFIQWVVSKIASLGILQWWYYDCVKSISTSSAALIE